MKKLLFVLALAFCVSPIFAKSYSEYLAEAKKYEAQKKWCYALGSYYDAMGTDEKPEDKQEAYEGYKALSEAIKSGNPGLGKFNKFTLPDEWKKLLIDAEKYGSSICVYDITLGNLEEESLDYKTKTATYSAEIEYELSDRYKKTIDVVANGFEVAYRDEWESVGLMSGWPDYSVSSRTQGVGNVYNIDGALVHCYRFIGRDGDQSCYGNAFAAEPYSVYEYDENIIIDDYNDDMDYIFGCSGSKELKKTYGGYVCEFNIVDEKGKKLVKGNKYYLGGNDNGCISFSGISSEVMDLIDDGRAFLDFSACYLEYGMLDGNNEEDSVFFESQIPLENVTCICGENQRNYMAENVFQLIINDMMANIDMEKTVIQVMKTEVTQELYESIMGKNPSKFIGKDLPVECVSYYDAIYFCNKLSEMAGLVPVYVVSGMSNVEDWGYRPHNGEKINETYLYENESANGFRLPTYNEWRDVANAGENYEFAGSENLNEVGWWSGNSESKTHPVAQKKPNGYGLYDMSGNVSEWVDFTLDRLSYTVIRGCLGGSYSHDGLWCSVRDGATRTYSERAYSNIGFRVMRSISE